MYLDGDLVLDEDDYANEIDFADAYEGLEEEDDEEDEEDGEEGEAEEEEEDEEDEFHDAEGGEVEVVLELHGADEDDEEGEDEERGHAAQTLLFQRHLLSLVRDPRGGLQQRRILDLLRRANLGHLFADDEELLNSLDDSRRRPRDPDRFPKVPSEKGRELMSSGVFGRSEVSRLRTKKRLARRLLDRELGLGTKSARQVNQSAIAQSLIPSTEAESTIYYHSPVYSGQFSDDGNFFYSCVKDFKVRMYDTSNPYKWRHYKTVVYPGGAWTLTDASLSPDNKWLAYTSIQSNVCLAPTDPNDTGDPYNLNLDDGRNTIGRWGRAFGIWSVRFSGDGRELVAGTNNNSIIVFDIESRRVLHQVRGHTDDVNAVCFADKSSPHILYSGSDDSLIKVWDRRSMGDGREAGAFVGHIEGLTYLDSKGDGRYILSNGKDQSMKLWDLKMMYSTAQFAELNPHQHTAGAGTFDYRWGPYDDRDWFPHPNDNSVVTYRGHSVLQTLIRCHFSPPGSTDSRYVYTGSHDGKVWIYNMDATVAGVIDVKKTSMNEHALPPVYDRVHARRGFRGWTTCVRDVAWHPNAPFIAASAINGWEHELGTVTLHSYNENKIDEGEPRMGTSYDDKMRPVRSAAGQNDSESDDDDYVPEEEESDDDIGW
ncbi:WD40-repeat-containing domain protein [Microdochium trichocladiopsis]|uniref:WD40-repeat-containing domain protein n=1 Tax=Microdochium trichocladiopsis TaxID=1682393 RepID=A0A9P8YDB9_9PEZI|nr:WD40-repeat-containing domain protein [Microdochium trichocladiopsis]KAH7037144.1 WD40-repeat-containing domain protein [Microdochium trichocladiopsis]